METLKLSCAFRAHSFLCFRALKFIDSATVERKKEINETIVTTCVFKFLMTATYPQK